MFRRADLRAFALAALLIGIARPQALSAAALTWNANATGAPVDGGGVWGTTSSNWWNSSTDAAWSNSSGSTAVFGSGGTAGTVTLGTPITAGGLTFNPVSSGFYTIAGGGYTLTLNSGATITTNANATISTNMAPAGAITMTGTGTLTLTGTTTLPSGTQTFYINNGSTSVTTPVVIDTGGSVTANGNFQDIGNRSNASLTVQGLGQFSTNSALNVGDNGTGSDSLTVSGSAHVTVTDTQYSLGVDFDGGAGTLNLSGGTLTTLRIAQRNGANLVNLNGGVLQAINTSGANFLGGITTANVQVGGAKIDSQSYNITISQVLSHDPSLGSALDGGLMKLGSGTLALTGANTFNGPTTINRGTLLLGNASALQSSSLNTSGTGALSFGGLTAATFGGLSGSGALALTNTALQNVALTVGGNNLNTSFAGNLSGGSLTKAGTGMLTLSGSDSYTGGTTISAGLLSFANTTALPSSGTISIASGGYAGIASDLNASGFLVKTNTASTGVIGIDGGATTVGLSLNGFAEGLRVGSATSGTLSGTFTPQTTTYHVGGGGGTLTISSSLADGSGPLALDMSTSGSLPAGSVVLASSNSYTGGTNVMAGLLQLAAGAGSLSASGAITVGGGTLDLGTNNQQTSGAIAFQGGTLQNGTLTNTGSAAFNAQSGTVSAILGGSLGLTKTTTATLTLSGSNTYSGTTTLSGGELSVSADANLGNGGGITFSGGTLQVTGTNYTSTARPIAWGPSGGGFDINAAANTFTVGQLLGGTGGLTKLGPGTLALTAANTYTGPTMIAAGTLVLGNSSALQSSSLNTSGTGALCFGGLTAATFGGLSGSGALALTNTALQSVALTVGGNNLNTSFSGNLSGGSLTKAGTGMLALSGSDSYTGGTTVSAGLLSFANTAALPSSGTISIASGGYAGIASDLNTSGFLLKTSTASTGVIGIDRGATTVGLSLNGFAEGLRVGSATSGTLSGTFIPQSNTYHVGGGGGTLTISSNLADASNPTALEMNTSGSLPAGSVVLASSNSYTGGTTVIAGTLQLGDGAANNGYVQGSILNNSTLAFANPAAQTWSGIISGSGALTTLGPGVLTITASNTYTGATTVHSTGGVAITGSGVFGNFVNPSEIGPTSGDNPTITINSPTAALEGSYIRLAENGGSQVTVNQSAGLASACTTNTGTNPGWFVIGSSGTASYNISGGTLVAAKPGNLQVGVLGSGVLNISNTATVQVTGGGSVYIGSDTAGSHGTVVQSDSSLFTVASGGAVLLGNNGFGSYTLNGGTLSTPTLTLGVGAAANGTFNLNGGLLLAATLNSGSGAAVFNWSGGTLQNYPGGGLTVALPVSLGGTNSTLKVDNGRTALFQATAPISGTGSLTKNGLGMLTLSDSNSYSGGTTVGGGTLQLGNSSALGTGGVTANNGTLDLAGFSPTVASLGGSNGLITVSGTTDALLTVSQTGTTNFGGTLQDGPSAKIGLTMAGAGTLQLSGTSKLSRAVAVNNGTLQVSGSLSVGPFNVSGSGQATGPGTIYLRTADGASFSSSTPNTFNGTFAGPGPVEVDSGSLTLTGTNTFSGRTNVAGGLLAAGAANALSHNSDVFVGTNSTAGTLDVSAFGGQTVHSLTIGGSGTLNVASNLPLTISGSAAFSPGSAIDVLGSIGALPDLLATYGGAQSGTPAGYINGSPLSSIGAKLQVSNGSVEVVVATSPTTYSLFAGSAGTLLHVGQSTTVTATITNTGGTLADNLSYSGLTISGPGTFSGSKSSTASLGSQASDSLAMSYTASVPGNITLTPVVGSATNATLLTSASAAGMSPATIAVFSGNAHWTGSGGTMTSWGNQGAAANWQDNNGIPAAPGTWGCSDSATFDSTAGTNMTVTLDGASPTLAALTFNTPAGGYTLGPGTGGTLTMTSGGASTSISVLSGTHSITAPLYLAGDLAISGSEGSVLGISGGISDDGGSRSLTLAGHGSGELILSGTNSYTGGTFVEDGTLIVNTGSALLDGSSLTVGAGGTFIFDSSVSGSPAVVTSQARMASVEPVPEPGTLMLLAAGVVVGLAAWRRRRG